MSSGSRRSKSSPNKEKIGDMPPPRKRKSNGDEAGQQSESEEEDCPQMTLREFCDHIYERENICSHETVPKKKWFLRDARIKDHEGIFDNPCLWLEVFPAPKKEPTQYGAVISAVVTNIEQKSSKGSTETKEYLLFMCLGGPKGFVAIILDPSKCDYSHMKKIDDPVCEAILEGHSSGDPLEYFLNDFQSNGEINLFPIIEDHYKKVSGEDIQLKSPRLKLKVKKPRETTANSEPNSDVPGDRLKKLPKQKRSNRTNTPKKATGSGATSDEHVEPVAVNTQNMTSGAMDTQNTVSSTEITEGEQMTTALARAEVSHLRSELQRLMDHKRVQITTVALTLDNLILDEDAKHPNSTLVRPLDKIHIENIKTLMMQKTRDFTVPFVLYVDPVDCPTVKDWSLVNCLNWKYRVIGGNHGARAKLDLWKAYKLPTHFNIQAWVYADLNKRDIHTLWWQHNIDQEYRKKMTNIDRIRACHRIFVNRGNVRGVETREECAQECALDGFVPGNRKTLQKHDPMFQIAFREGSVWELQDQIFEMWNNLECLGQKKMVSPRKPKPTKGKLKGQAVQIKPLQKLAGDINMNLFRALQGISTETVLLQCLERVKLKKISLETMAGEAEKYKKILKIKNLFMQVAGEKDWAKCREMFPKETQFSELEPFIDNMKEALKVCSKKKKGKFIGNAVDEVGDEELPTSQIPINFQHYVAEAIRNYNRRKGMLCEGVESADFTWKDATGDIMSYSILTGDVRAMAKFLPKRCYTLAIADIPYGFNARGSENDERAFDDKDLADMISNFQSVTTAKAWRFVIIHSLQQANNVMLALEKVCNAGIEAGIWEKPNVHDFPAGNRLSWAFENWTIGYFHESGTRTRDMYNFEPNESRRNIVTVPCVTKKSVTQLEEIVNPYQKPVGLSEYFVKHFSSKGEWVVDLCAGTGSTTCAALLCGRHCVAIELSASQSQYIKERVRGLEPTWEAVSESLEKGSGAEAQEVNPPIGGATASVLTEVVEILEEEVELSEENVEGAENVDEGTTEGVEDIVGVGPREEGSKDTTVDFNEWLL